MKHFIEAICPTPSRYCRKNKKAAATEGEEDDDDDDEYGEADPETGLFPGEEADAEWETGDVLGHALAFVTQVR